MTPPRLAVWLAGIRLNATEREFALGDLEEDFLALAQARGRTAAVRWYWRQAIRGLFVRRPRGRSTSGFWLLASPPRTPIMLQITQDIRFAFRILRRAPGFTALVIITLALGIGATTTIFTVVHASLLKRLPFANSDRLVLGYNAGNLTETFPVSYPQFIDWRDRSNVFDAVGGWFNSRVMLGGDGEPEYVQGVRCSASLFETLGIKPMLGRTFSRDDEARTAPLVVLISEALWRRRFAASADVIGRPIILNGTPFTVLGVIPNKFHQLRPTDGVRDLFVPLRVSEATAPRSLNFMYAIGLLKPGQSIAQASQQLQDAELRFQPTAQPPPHVGLAPIRETLVSEGRPVLLALLGAVGFLLLITCANLANLLLARAVHRRREIAVRLALGAGRRRVFVQLLTECLVLAGVGGAAGLAVAALLVRSVAGLNVIARAGIYDLALDWTVGWFAVGVSLLVGLLFGLFPAMGAGRMSHVSALRSGDRASTGPGRLRQSLIVVEIALTLVLLVGAGLLTRSLVKLTSVEKGFESRGVVTGSLSPSGVRYRTSADQTRFFDNVLDKLSRLPGVEAVGLTNYLPLVSGDVDGGIEIDGKTFPPGQRPRAQKRVVSAGYFSAMGIPVLRGRAFTATDVTGAEPVMIVSDTFARRYFPGEEAIGKRADFLWETTGLQTIVGVVADVKHQGLDDPPNSTVYVPYTQRPDSAFSVVVRTRGEAASLLEPLRTTIRAIDPGLPVTGLHTMDEVLSQSIGNRRFSLELVTAFAVLGLVLAATGIYSVVSYATEQRAREFGIRMALGAAAPSLLRQVLAQGAMLAIVGLGPGLVATIASGGVIRNQLFNVDPVDPLTLASVSAVVLVVSLAACYVPARRAMKVDPASVLRSE
jgi:putative ABC transport system permease protein